MVFVLTFSWNREEFFNLLKCLSFGIWGWGEFVFLKKCLFMIVVNVKRFYILAQELESGKIVFIYFFVCF